MYLTGNYEERKAFLEKMTKKQLEDALLDDSYNKFIRQYCDIKDDEEDLHGHGKRLPYIGWFWREVRFSKPDRIPIGNCGAFVGFMENNKWDHPERWLTKEEGLKVISFIDEAISLSNKSTNIKDIYNKFEELWAYMQILET